MCMWCVYAQVDINIKTSINNLRVGLSPRDRSNACFSLELEVGDSSPGLCLARLCTRRLLNMSAIRDVVGTLSAAYTCAVDTSMNRLMLRFAASVAQSREICNTLSRYTSSSWPFLVMPAQLMTCQLSDDLHAWEIYKIKLPVCVREGILDTRLLGEICLQEVRLDHSVK